jgi:hypothetical protein
MPTNQKVGSSTLSGRPLFILLNFPAPALAICAHPAQTVTLGSAKENPKLIEEEHETALEME